MPRQSSQQGQDNTSTMSEAFCNPLLMALLSSANNIAMSSTEDDADLDADMDILLPATAQPSLYFIGNVGIVHNNMGLIAQHPLFTLAEKEPA